MNTYKKSSRKNVKKPEKIFDENQPREQVWFRSKNSTTDHIHVVNLLKAKCREYNITLCIAFVDYENAFGSVQIQAVVTSLQEQGIENVYIELLKEMHTNSTMTVHLHKESNTFNIRRGARQGDTKAVYGSTRKPIRRQTWETIGLKIDGGYLSHLHFADDVLVCANTPHHCNKCYRN
ncbi:hypothetical protein NP493_781g01024 [Ridgeia piscesae]|uniref:Reverse transcriptase domain-containing protein n=1 Tax=Ridgeia piscesae TaxID=27915 RepID=A0AAD9KN88_RIDPI|nr:hypothetical protein NP493_781g01024 [Ridgeia piscesae]